MSNPKEAPRGPGVLFFMQRPIDLGLSPKPWTLDPKALNPKTLNPRPQNPEALNLEFCAPAPRF